MKWLVGFLVGMAIVHAIVLSITPVQGEAWLHLVWAGRHPDSGIATWLAAHFASADAIGYVLARCNAINVVVTPMVAVALVINLFTIAIGRSPRRGDALPLALVSALIWSAQPHAGVTWFYTPSVAEYIYGAMFGSVVIAALRCGWNVGRWTPVMMLFAYGAGTSSRAIAMVTLVVGFWLARSLRDRWVKLVLFALVVGTVVGFVHARLEVAKVLRRGLDPNLFVLRLPFEEIGKIVALVTLFALVELGMRVLGRERLSDDTQPDSRVAVRCLVGYFATAVLCMFGPKYFEASLFPATCLLVVAALPWLMWFASERRYRIALIAFAVAVHAIIWPAAIITYHQLGHEAAVRQDILSHSQPGDLAIVRPSSEILPTYFWYGEDLSTPRLRQLVALDVFGLRDIAVSPVYRRYEINPQIEVAFEQEGATTDELANAHPPRRWSTVPSVARDQFEELLHRIGKPITARLVVKNVDFKERGTRPLLLAWATPSEIVSPRTAVAPVDEENQFLVKMYSDLKRFDEAWVVADGHATKTPYRNGSPKARPTTPTLHSIVVCNSDRCLLEDAFVARF